MAADALRDAADATRREQVIASRRAGYAGGVAEPTDKLEAIRAARRVFEDIQAPYALIGGLAVGIRSGVPRATLDVNLVVASRVDRASLVERMVERGFRLTGEFVHSANFRHQSGEPVQLAFDPWFDAMIARAEAIDMGDMELRVVTTDDLIAMKRRAAADPGRRRSKALRDQADIALLEGDVPDADEGW